MNDRVAKYLDSLAGMCKYSPSDWNAFYAHLMKLRGEADSPPFPFILAASGESDASKLGRLGEQLEWAESVGALEAAFLYLDQLSEAEWSHGNPETWNFDSYPNYTFGYTSGPKPKMDVDTAKSLIQRLNASWLSIAGPEISRSTKPLYFAGRKGRRLVVFAEPYTSPPWGTIWNSLGRPSGSFFTSFRKSVNDAIKPWEVDHIDFAHKMPISRKSLRR